MEIEQEKEKKEKTSMERKYRNTDNNLTMNKTSGKKESTSLEEDQKR